MGAIVGVGIFVLAGQQAATNAGPAVVLSFIIAGLGSACAALMIGVGAFYIDPDNWTPFIPTVTFDADGLSHFGWGGVLAASSIVFFAVAGITSVMFAFMLGAARIWFALSRDGLLPKWFA